MSRWSLEAKLCTGNCESIPITQQMHIKPPPKHSKTDRHMITKVHLAGRDNTFHQKGGDRENYLTRLKASRNRNRKITKTKTQKTTKAAKKPH